MTPRRTFWEFSAATMWVVWVIIVKVLRFLGIDPLMWNGRVILLGALLLPILDQYGVGGNFRIALLCGLDDCCHRGWRKCKTKAPPLSRWPKRPRKQAFPRDMSRHDN